MDPAAVRELAGLAHQVGRVSGREALAREFLRWISRGRLGRAQGRPVVPRLATPWQDTLSDERIGWRQRAANLADHPREFAFAVDYEVCRRCRLGWVEQPYTMPKFQRCGLAAAGLAALSAEHPGFAWHTLGGHLGDSRSFWAAVGAGVEGGYQQRGVCQHVSSGADHTARQGTSSGGSPRGSSDVCAGPDAGATTQRVAPRATFLTGIIDAMTPIKDGGGAWRSVECPRLPEP